MNNLLAGKTGLIMGVANDKSIAWSIAEVAHKQGANLIFTYQSEVLKKRVEPLAASIGCANLVECDVTNEQTLDTTFEQISKISPKIDFVIHAIAFSNKDELKGRYADTSKENFLNTMDVSCYSLVSIARRAEKLMPNGGSIITLSYYGAEKVIPNYNVMGVAKAALEASVRYLAADLGVNNIRVNAISAGPIRTLAASGITGFRSFLKTTEAANPLKRNTTQEDVANCSLYLSSDLASGVTGEVIHVDCGYHAVGMFIPQSEETE